MKKPTYAPSKKEEVLARLIGSLRQKAGPTGCSAHNASLEDTIALLETIAAAWKVVRKANQKDHDLAEAHVAKISAECDKTYGPRAEGEVTWKRKETQADTPPPESGHATETDRLIRGRTAEEITAEAREIARSSAGDGVCSPGGNVT